MNRNLSDLADILYKEVGSINAFTVKPIHYRLINDIHHKEDFLIYNFRTFDSNYTTGLLLTFPTLWINLTMSSWKNICTSIFPRKSFEIGNSKFSSEDQTYGDMIFIHKILRLNPFQFWTKSLIKKQEMINAFNFSDVYAIRFFQDESDLLQDLNEYYSISIHELENYCMNMQQEGCQKGFDNQEAMRKYIENAKIQLD